MTKTHEFNLTGAARKPLIHAIESFANVKGVYQGAPKFGYAFYGIGVLDKEGALHFDCDLQVIMDCVTWLEEQGFTCDTTPEETAEPEIPCFPEQPHEDWENCAGDFREFDGLPPKRKGIMDIIVDELNENEADGGHWERLHSTPQMECGDGKWRNLDGTFAGSAPTGGNGAQENGGSEHDALAIEMPLDGFTPEKLDNLAKLIDSKRELIKAAIGADGTLPVSQTEEGNLRFDWFPYTENADEVSAYTTLVSKLCSMAKELQRVTSKEKTVYNQRFAFRVFLIRLGFVGDDYKTARKILLRNLSGNSAFKNGPPPKPGESEEVNDNAE